MNDAPDEDVADAGEAPSPEADLVLVGVGHVFDIHDALRALIHSTAPQVVLVELDQRRYAALTNPDEAEMTGGLYGLMARFQQKAADALETTPGQEMLTAIEAARQTGARAGLIDMDAQRAFARMWQEMTIKEKLKFVWAALTGLFVSEDRIAEEVEGLGGDYTDLLEAFAVQFPSAKKVLIDERNEVMAKRIRHQCGEFDRVLAVLGDGHIEGIEQLVGDLDPRVVRLKDLLEGRVGGWQAELSEDGSEAQMSFGGEEG